MMMKSHVMVRRSNRLRRAGSHGVEDRLSALPDGLLCDILDFLPTNDAVATCILSSRWKFVWTNVHNLCFDDRLWVRPGALPDVVMIGFSNFIQNVLDRTEGAKIYKFSVHWSSPPALCRIKGWISSAVMRDVREIELYMGVEHRFELPESIYTCKTLEVLKLDSDFIITIPTDGQCFPSLKILRVLLEYPENSLTEKLFSICPSLEFLEIKAYMRDGWPAPNFIISSSTLKSLALTVCLEEDFIIGAEHNVVITAPNLESLVISAESLGSYQLQELNSIMKAVLNVFFVEWTGVDANRAIQLLQGLTKTKILTLSPGMIYALHELNDKLFPLFPDLTYLEVKVGQYGWGVLPIILNSLSKLEYLVLEKTHWIEFVDDEFGWIEKENVAECLCHHVKKIEVKGIEGDEDELPLLEYLLKHSAVLETMIIITKGTRGKRHLKNLRQKLLTYERGSDSTEINVF